MFRHNIPKEIEYQQEEYYLESYFIKVKLDLEGLAYAEVREYDSSYYDPLVKEALFQLKAAAIKHDSEVEDTFELGYYSYYNDWWNHFKAEVAYPYIKKLGLENTWLKDVFVYKASFESYVKRQEFHNHYWNLVVAPPNTNVYCKHKLLNDINS